MIFLKGTCLGRLLTLIIILEVMETF